MNLMPASPMTSPSASWSSVTRIGVKSFRSLPLSDAGPYGQLPTLHTRGNPRLKPDDAAVLAFTDFRQQAPLTTDPAQQIDDALREMMNAGVRALLVLHEGSLTGLITSYDIQGEKPLLFLRQACIHDSCRHQDVMVADVMTPWQQAPKLAYETLLSSRIGDLMKTFERDDEVRHLLVVEARAAGIAQLRGIVSRSHVERLLR